MAFKSIVQMIRCERLVQEKTVTQDSFDQGIMEVDVSSLPMRVGPPKPEDTEEVERSARERFSQRKSELLAAKGPQAFLYKVGQEAPEAVKPKDGRFFSLEELQAFVGGFIEIHTLQDGRLVVCNEEGRLARLEGNNAATKVWQDNAQGGDLLGNILITDASFVE